MLNSSISSVEQEEGEQWLQIMEDEGVVGCRLEVQTIDERQSLRCVSSRSHKHRIGDSSPSVKHFSRAERYNMCYSNFDSL